jgi:recombination protein RecR
MPEALKKLINTISYLPWIGEKSATKLGFFLLNANKNYLENFKASIDTIQTKIGKCESCWCLVDAWKPQCHICENPKRKSYIICVVEEYLDMLTIEQSGQFDGVYHILWGAISPMNGIFIGDLSFEMLFSRIEVSEENVELILATNPNIEWEATNAYLKEEIAKRDIAYKTTITKLSRWLSSWYLEYADNITIINALRDRKKV